MSLPQSIVRGEGAALTHNRSFCSELLETPVTMKDLTWLLIKTLIVSPTLGEILKTAWTGAKSPDFRPDFTFDHFVLFRGTKGRSPSALGTTPHVILLKIKGPCLAAES